MFSSAEQSHRAEKSSRSSYLDSAAELVNRCENTVIEHLLSSKYTETEDRGPVGCIGVSNSLPIVESKRQRHSSDSSSSSFSKRMIHWCIIFTDNIRNLNNSPINLKERMYDYHIQLLFFVHLYLMLPKDLRLFLLTRSSNSSSNSFFLSTSAASISFFLFSTSKRLAESFSNSLWHLVSRSLRKLVVSDGLADEATSLFDKAWHIFAYVEEKIGSSTACKILR